MNNFRVGQKVVCIEMDRLYPHGVEPVDEPIQPVVGTIYTVRQVLLGKIGEVPCIKVDEIPDHRIQVLVNGELLIGDVVFDAAGFRPVVERGTDAGMSILREILNKADQPVREDA